MKYIGIITFAKCNNYGAELQAFALQHYLRSHGFNAEIIDYLHYKNKDHRKTLISKPIFKISNIQKFKEAFFSYKNKLNKIIYYKNYNLREKNFKEFHEQFTCF